VDEEVYQNIVFAGHVPRTDPSKPFLPKVKKSKRNNVDNEKPGSKKPRGGGTSAALALLASGEVVVGRG
jgi:hypothetical protein